jgi:hypothetical protein
VSIARMVVNYAHGLFLNTYRFAECRIYTATKVAIDKFLHIDAPDQRKNVEHLHKSDTLHGHHV